MSRNCVLCVVLLSALIGLSHASSALAGGVIGTSRDEFTRIGQLIAYYQQNEMPERLLGEALRQDALILSLDRDPTDVIMRRTRALLNHIRTMDGVSSLAIETQLLDNLAEKCDMTSVEDIDARRRLFDELTPLRRRIALKNPLLDFDRIIFLTHHKMGRGDRHMVDQYEGHNMRPGGGLFILNNPFGERPTAVDLLKNKTVDRGRLTGQTLDTGSFVALDLDYDANTVLFAYTEAVDPPTDPALWDGQHWPRSEAVAEKHAHYFWGPQTCFHVFKASVDGTRLEQLTDGSWNDFDPCFLPNGRIVFNSERRGGFLRCGARPNPTFTLHGMMADGSDIIPLSLHETNEWHPSVTNDGMIVYSRWDYVDRDSDIAHHPWLCYPDGRDPRSYHGNYPDARENRPWMELSIRAVPDSQKFVAVSTPHHGQNYGSIVLIDQRLEDDRATGQLKRVTPEVLFPEAETSPGVPGRTHGGKNSGGEVYGQPWPLDEDFYLCGYDPGESHYGLYLLDSFGNKIHLYTDPDVPVLDPIPLKSRTRPPVIPHRTSQALADRTEDGLSVLNNMDDPSATIGIMNVYDAELPWPEGTVIDAIRVVQIFPKTTRKAASPNIGYGAQSLGRGVLGTAAVEEDGSVLFEAPINTPIYFQALDPQGRAIQTMRSDTYVHRGEQMVCQGCHEKKQSGIQMPVTQPPLAMRKPPQKLSGDVQGSWPLTFPRLVQPVLDAKCVDCHEEEKDAPSLAATVSPDSKYGGLYGWSDSFQTLGPLGWYKSGGNGALSKNVTSFSIPGDVGARASKLLPLLEKGHYDVKLTDEELYRITLWMDLNSNFYGVYRELESQANGELVLPVLE